MSEPMHTRAFSFDGLTVRVVCAARADLVWLAEFLAPWFEGSSGNADCRVDLIADDREYGTSLDRATRSACDDVHCFSLDSGELRLPSWQESGALFVRDDRLRCVYAVEGSPARVRILTAVGSVHARFAAMRVVRELAMEQARARGRLLLHAACLAVGDDAFLIAGPKGAGKTSLLLRGLLRGGSRFVSNDRVVVRFASGQATAHGIPTIVSIRRQTLDRDAALRQRLEQTPPPHWLDSSEEANVRRTARSGVSSIDLTPAQVCAILRVETSAAGRVRALLFPRVHRGGDSQGARELDPTTARQRISQALFGASAEGSAGPGLFASLLPRRPYASPAAATGDDLVARVPSFELPMGAREDAIRRALAEILDRCAARTDSPRPAADRPGSNGPG